MELRLIIGVLLVYVYMSRQMSLSEKATLTICTLVTEVCKCVRGYHGFFSMKWLKWAFIWYPFVTLCYNASVGCVLKPIRCGMVD